MADYSYAVSLAGSRFQHIVQQVVSSGVDVRQRYEDSSLSLPGLPPEPGYEDRGMQSGTSQRARADAEEFTLYQNESYVAGNEVGNIRVQYYSYVVSVEAYAHEKHYGESSHNLPMQMRDGCFEDQEQEVDDSMEYGSDGNESAHDEMEVGNCELNNVIDEKQTVPGMDANVSNSFEKPQEEDESMEDENDGVGGNASEIENGTILTGTSEELLTRKHTAEAVLVRVRDVLGKAVRPIVSYLHHSGTTEQDDYETCLKLMSHSKTCAGLLGYSQQELRYEIRHILSSLRRGKKGTLTPETCDHVKDITTFLYGVEAALNRNERHDLASMICKPIDEMTELEKEVADLIHYC